MIFVKAFHTFYQLQLFKSDLLLTKYVLALLSIRSKFYVLFLTYHVRIYRPSFRENKPNTSVLGFFSRKIRAQKTEIAKN
jgi:hypothetical protein